MPPKKSLSELEREYELELDKINKEIQRIKKKDKTVLLQFPDGLKPYATTIVDYFEEKFPNATFLIWLESCYGACDTPVLSKEIEKKIDILIQFGHSKWKK